MTTPLDRSWLFLRGRAGELVERYEVETHPLHAEALSWAEAEAARRGGRGTGGACGEPAATDEPADGPEDPFAPDFIMMLDEEPPFTR